MVASTQKTASVWTLGNTTVRNPDRILGALIIFSKYYSCGKTFSSNHTQQGYFFEKLLTHNENGIELTSSSHDLPFYSYENDGETEMKSDEYKQKNGRLWLSVLESFGFIIAYGDSTTSVSDVGNSFIEFPKLATDIWLRQLLKFQYPNLRSEINGGGSFPFFLIKINGTSRATAIAIPKR